MPAKPSSAATSSAGTVSGPVSIPKVYNGHDRTFFVFSWESYRQELGDTRLTSVPGDRERQGDFSATGPLKDPLLPGACTAGSAAGCFPGNRIPASRISPAALKAIALFPEPNLPGASNNFRAVANQSDSWDSYVAKMDDRITSKNSISYRFLKRFSHTANPFNGSDSGVFGNRVLNNQTLTGLTYTRIFSPALIGEARVGFSRTADRERGDTQGHNYAADFGIPGVTADPKLIGFPRFTIRNLAALGEAANLPVEFTVNNISYSGAVT